MVLRVCDRINFPKSPEFHPFLDMGTKGADTKDCLYSHSVECSCTQVHFYIPLNHCQLGNDFWSLVS